MKSRCREKFHPPASFDTEFIWCTERSEDLAVYHFTYNAYSSVREKSEIFLEIFEILFRIEIEMMEICSIEHWPTKSKKKIQHRKTQIETRLSEGVNTVTVKFSTRLIVNLWNKLANKRNLC